MSSWKDYKGQIPWTAPYGSKFSYNEGDRITKAPIASGGSPIWSMEKKGTAITDRHIPCGYWTRDYTPPAPPAPPASTEEALVFENGGVIYLATLTAVGYTLIHSTTHGLSGWVVGAGWDRDNEQFIIIEDDYTNINLHKVATDGTLISSVILTTSPIYYALYRGYTIPETEKIYFIYSVIETEGVWPNQTENLYIYFWQFGSTGLLENSWTTKLLSIRRGSDTFINTYNIPSIILDGSDYIVTVTVDYSIDSILNMYRSCFFCNIVDGTAVEYKDIISDTEELGSAVSIGTNLYREILNNGLFTSFDRLYLSTIASPASTSLIAEIARDPTYYPWLAAEQKELGLFISDQGIVMEVSTGSILYTITELSDYFGNALARTLKTV